MATSKKTSSGKSVQKGSKSTQNQRLPSQVFISYKHTDEGDKLTKDYEMAKALYEALIGRDICVFFSAATLKERGADKFSEEIDRALDEADILVAVGTSAEHLQSNWVKSEWKGFIQDMRDGIKPNGKAFAYIDEMELQQLPRDLRSVQVFKKSVDSLDDICDYIANALNAPPKPKVKDLSEKGNKYSAAPIRDQTNLLTESAKYFTKAVSKAYLKGRDELEALAKKHSRFFSVISTLEQKKDGKKVNLPVGDNLIFDLVDFITKSDSKNLLKISGNNGAEKNALMQILYLLTYRKTLHQKTEYLPFYINLPYYEKAKYDPNKDLGKQIKEKISDDLCCFIELMHIYPDYKPILFVDGIRDFNIGKTDLERVLESIIHDIDWLRLVVSVDTGLTQNKQRLKRSQAIASTNFEYFLQVNAVNLAEDSLCDRFFEAFTSTYEIEVADLRNKFKSMAFYEVDSYILRKAAKPLRDYLESTEFNISDLYEEMCKEMLKGDSDALLLAARTAYRFAYEDTPFEDAEVFSAEHWRLIKRHRSFIDFLISYYYVHRLEEFEDGDDIHFFEQVLPKEITRFVTPRLNSSFTYEEKVLLLAKKHYEEMGVLGKSEMTFWLGRLHYPTLAGDAKQMLKSLYDSTGRMIREKKEQGAYQNIQEEKVDLFLLRGITVSLIYGGESRIAENYICQMLDNDLMSEINKGFHLEYYGDKPYLPNRDMLDFEDKPEVGEKTMKRLVKNIERHLECTGEIPLLELDLFTLCSLIQARIGTDRILCSYNILPYVQRCIEFITKYKSRITSTSNGRIIAYFGMIYDDLNAFLGSEKALSMTSAVFNTYAGAKAVKRTGWVDLDIPSPENIVEHMYNTWLLGMLNLPEQSNESGYDKGRILNMILIHDLGETLTGDIPKPAKARNPEYALTENTVMQHFLLKGTYPKMANLSSYYDLWEEWYRQETLNAKIAKELDVIQALYQFHLYYKLYPEKIPDEKRDSWIREYAELRTPIGIEIYKKVIQSNPEFHETLEFLKVQKL